MVPAQVGSPANRRRCGGIQLQVPTRSSLHCLQLSFPALTGTSSSFGLPPVARLRAPDCVTVARFGGGLIWILGFHVNYVSTGLDMKNSFTVPLVGYTVISNSQIGTNRKWGFWFNVSGSDVAPEYWSFNCVCYHVPVLPFRETICKPVRIWYGECKQFSSRVSLLCYIHTI